MYPLPVEMWSPVRPRGRDTNITAAITPPAIQGFDYWSGFTWITGARLTVLNTDGHPWWLGPPGEDDVQGPFSSAFSSAYRVVD